MRKSFSLSLFLLLAVAVVGCGGCEPGRTGSGGEER